MACRPPIEAGPAQRVETAVGVDEALGDVHRALDVHDAVAAPRRAEHRQAGALVIDQLEVHAVAPRAHGREQLAGQAVALQTTGAGDDGHGRMQGEAEAGGSRLDHQSLEMHVAIIGAPQGALEPFGPWSWVGRLTGVADRVGAPAGRGPGPDPGWGAGTIRGMIAGRRRPVSATRPLSSVGRAFPW